MEYIGYKGIKVPIGTHEGKSVIIGSDHRGYLGKEGVKRYFERHRATWTMEDAGTYSEASCDYPIFAAKIAEAVRESDNKTVGIGICGTGIGMSMAANKVRGVYAARCLTVDDARLSRQHNDANFLALSADATNLEKMVEIIEAWLGTSFEDGGDKERFLRRYVQTLEIERGCLGL